MEVNDDMIKNLAQLARLEFKEEEKEEIKNDLRKMIAFIGKLKELDTTGVEPMLHMSENINVLREDVAKQTITREEALQNAPFHDKQYFKVPKVIKKD
ncbi:MAG: Asp-tRNA(Asn)/Glu-tRNA(Gln) amidotransferase subunit GatC [Ginsengibacter sp.]